MSAMAADFSRRRGPARPRPPRPSGRRRTCRARSRGRARGAPGPAGQHEHERPVLAGQVRPRAQQRVQPRRVEEGHAAEVEDERADGAPHRQLDLLAELRRGLDVELARERDRVRAADLRGARLQARNLLQHLSPRSGGPVSMGDRRPGAEVGPLAPFQRRRMRAYMRESGRNRVWRTRPSRSSTPIPSSGSCSTSGDYERARRDALARVSRLSPGVWDAAAALERDAHHRGFLIVDGLMAREVDVMGRRCCELLGHGDVLRPWSWDAEGSHVQAEVGWTVLEETTLAVLDHGLVKRIVPWPTLGVELFNRGTRRAHHLAVALAISHHQRVDDRLLLTLWHLAERWGRVTPERHRRPAAARPPAARRPRRRPPARRSRRRSASSPAPGRSRAARTATGCCTARRRSSCATTSSPRRSPSWRQTWAGSPAASVAAAAALRRHGSSRITPASGSSSPAGQIVAGSWPSGGGAARKHAQACSRAAGSVTHAARHSATATSCAGSQ